MERTAVVQFKITGLCAGASEGREVLYNYPSELVSKQVLVTLGAQSLHCPHYEA